jgi:hypothetical protein
MNEGKNPWVRDRRGSAFMLEAEAEARRRERAEEGLRRHRHEYP